MAITYAEIDSVTLAANFLRDFETAYNRLLGVQTGIDLYLAATDPVFNGTINAAVDAAVISDFTALKSGLDDLIYDWDTSYGGLVRPT